MTKIIKGDLILTKDTVFEESIEVQSNIICKSERFSLKVRGDINARNIKAGDINALNINAWNINAEDIKAGDIKAWNINAEDINARDIKAEDINAGDINAGNINARDIKAWNINARNINARNIKAEDINAGNINAGDINAWNINAEDINARDINAWNINAEDINFYAVCFAYEKFICKSIKGRQENSKYFSLDGEVIIKSPQPSFLDRTDIPDILDEFYVDIESKVEDSTVKDLIKWLNAKVF